MNDKLVPGKAFHVLNRGVDGMEIFRRREDYQIFIERYQKYIQPIAYTYSYCLMPNHFHILLKIKPLNLLPEKVKGNINDARFIRRLSQPFSNLFNSYATSFNRFYGRKDKVFSQPFSKIMIENENYFKYLIYYIHRNPVHHKFCYDLDDWQYSSYWDYLKNDENWFTEKAFKKYFDSKQDFKNIHHQIIESFLDEKFLLE